MSKNWKKVLAFVCTAVSINLLDYGTLSLQPVYMTLKGLAHKLPKCSTDIFPAFSFTSPKNRWSVY